MYRRGRFIWLLVKVALVIAPVLLIIGAIAMPKPVPYHAPPCVTHWCKYGSGGTPGQGKGGGHLRPPHVPHHRWSGSQSQTQTGGDGR